MVKEGKYERALEIIMEELPLPGILGRICPHGCEDACRRMEVDDALAIRDLKRLAADQFDCRDVKIECAPARKEKVAIIGSGPAGLSAAYHLARAGVLSTIYEALPQAGGMLRVGIPAHRLPRKILDQEIEVITNLGVEIKTDTPLGPDLTVDDLFDQGFQAVYLALGAHKGIELGIPGEKSKGVRQGVDFLREVNLKGTAPVGKKVAIIGGGNVAIDVARSAVRLGAEEVSIIYRRTRAEMPAWEEEIHAAEEEGTQLTYLAAPQEVLVRDGQVVGVRCIRMELGEPDSSGRRRPVPVPGSEYDIEIDQLIPAIGQRPDLSSIEDVTGMEFTRWGTAETDAITYATGREGVFAGGDLQTGPWVAIGAIAHGLEAAESIVRYLDGADMAAGREPAEATDPVLRPVPEGEPKRSRAKMPELAVAARGGNFDEVELGYEETEGRAEASRCINCGYCCECFLCVDACLAEAVVHDQQPAERELAVGSVIVSAGADPYDPSVFEEFYHYQRNPNVVTSLEFERLLSASGPTMGHLVRPSDDSEPAKIAWLQCVGSRDTNRCGNGYCSSVCCMYAIKDAMVAKEHAGDGLDCAIFNMDIRSFGKDYEKYYLRARDKEGVRFVNARIHTINEDADSGDLELRYVDDAGNTHLETFNMVVLSVGLQVSQDTKALAERLDIALDKYNFAATDVFAPVSTSRAGVYTCGIFQGPKDIPESVTQASAAASASAVKLASARYSATRTLEVPEQVDVTEQEPRVGVFVCNCGINIAGVVDVAAVEEYAKSLPNVVYTGQNLFSCSQDSQELMKDLIKEHGINRVVVSACSPKTHEPIFMDTLEAVGLNKYLFEMANIRNQDSWVHSGEPEEATEKAKELVRMSVARAANLRPLEEKVIPVNKKALVVGGGVAGMTAALDLGGQGFEVYLVEKASELGGMARSLHKTIEGNDVQGFLQDLIARVGAEDKITVFTDARISGFSGYKGNFSTDVEVGPDNTLHTVGHGAIVVATGAVEYQPTEYMYGENDRVVTQLGLSDRLAEKGASDLSSVVMVQCVGSRCDENPNCSRICCQNAVKNALAIKDKNPETQVYVLYRDIRTYGLMEEYYTAAREQGVIFIRFDEDAPPAVTRNGDGLAVTVKDHILQKDLEIAADMLVLSAAVEAADTEELSNIMKLSRSPEGFFIEAHVKLRPVDMAGEGVYLCGTAHGPKLISETISQAHAAASRAATLLSQSEIKLSAITAKVDTDTCVKCLTCVRCCPFEVPVFNTAEKLIEIDEALCRGCGVCTAVCPRHLIHLSYYEDDQIMSKIEALLAEGE
jgi:heterodisulfide reductase subunit A-like polyferredoxin